MNRFPSPSRPMAMASSVSGRESSSYRSSIPLSASPSQSSVVYHSLPAHPMDRSNLLALQQQYLSNPQLEEERNRQAASLSQERRSILHSQPPSFSRSSHSLETSAYPSFSSTHDHSTLDPSPLLDTRSPDLSLSALTPSSPPTLAASADPSVYKPVRRWLAEFPRGLDQCFFRLDNAVTRVVQRPLVTVGGLTTSLEAEILASDSESSRQTTLATTTRNKILVHLALLYSTFTTIELGVMAPLFCFLIGWDELATLCLFTVLFTAVFSQGFKRFVWRPRPWMAGRAIQVKRDLTSSFPSRAVICAVAYAYLFAHIWYPKESPLWFSLTLVLTYSLGAAISRIFVGAHFFSDCLFGFLLGSICSICGALLNRAVMDSCGSCYSYECYATSPDLALSFSSLSSLNPTIFSVALVGSTLVVGLAMSSPLHFWVKCLPLFGILAPCVAFRLLLLCPDHNSHMALNRMERPDALGIILAAAISVAALYLFKLVNRLIMISESVQLSSAAELIVDDADSPTAAPSSALSPHSESVRRFLHFSSLKQLAWNLIVFLLAFATILMVLLAWRFEYATPAKGK